MNTNSAEYTYDDLAVDSMSCCEIAGQDRELSKYDKLCQFKYILSETQELLEAIEADDLIKQADGCVDILITVLGMIKKLENQGMYTSAVMLDIANNNNFSKFPKDEQTAIDTVEMYANQGVQCTYSYNEDYEVYVVRDSDGKYRKPVGFKDVQTEGWFKKGVV